MSFWSTLFTILFLAMMALFATLATCVIVRIVWFFLLIRVILLAFFLLVFLWRLFLTTCLALLPFLRFLFITRLIVIIVILNYNNNNNKVIQMYKLFLHLMDFLIHHPGMYLHFLKLKLKKKHCNFNWVMTICLRGIHVGFLVGLYHANLRANLEKILFVKLSTFCSSDLLIQTYSRFISKITW